MILVYITYEEYKNKYLLSQKKFDCILREKEELFSITQPKSAKFDKGIISKTNNGNIFDEYLIIKEQKQIDQRLDEIKSIMEDRERLLKLKEEELRHSKHYLDKIYRLRYLDKWTVSKIARILSYSESQVYRLLKKIARTL